VRLVFSNQLAQPARNAMMMMPARQSRREIISQIIHRIAGMNAHHRAGVPSETICRTQEDEPQPVTFRG
jgi:hypothetical protein